MTKREMKEKIAERCKESWNDLCESTSLFGANDKVTNRDRARWAVLDNLYTELFNESIEYEYEHE